jgi:hypothetical protein
MSRKHLVNGVLPGLSETRTASRVAQFTALPYRQLFERTFGASTEHSDYVTTTELL